MIYTGIEKDPEAAVLKAKLLGSFLLFTQTFFRLRTGRDFIISQPVSREPHQITIARELTDLFYSRIPDQREWMTLPPGHGKSTFMTYFVAWAFAHYPDCNFIYVSYSNDLASEHTSNIKAIMQMPLYKNLFGVHISGESKAKDDFKTLQGGAVKAYGSEGAVTGNNAGLPGLNRFSGALIMDDMHKPNEVFSDAIRENVIRNFQTTIKMRPRGPNVPIIGIGHALHEEDLRAFLLSGKDGRNWKNLCLKAVDDAGNILAPDLTPKAMLDAEREYNDYVYWSQYQGEPKPAGGGIFKTENFVLLDHYPEMIATFITVDTAESTKDYADYSVFSFFGVYAIEYEQRKTGDYGLHCIDCLQARMEPSDIEPLFRDFYKASLEFKTPPTFAAIEKKSTGVTLLSVLQAMRGMDVRNIERTSATGSKTARFLEMQPYVNRRLISFPKYGKHTTMCIDHLGKITANNTHRHDDIADTFYDGVKIGLMSKLLINENKATKNEQIVTKNLMGHFNRIQRMRQKL
jgi:predicted phage terminase large subunit-like protein